MAMAIRGQMIYPRNEKRPGNGAILPQLLTWGYEKLVPPAGLPDQQALQNSQSGLPWQTDWQQTAHAPAAPPAPQPLPYLAASPGQHHAPANRRAGPLCLVLAVDDYEVGLCGRLALQQKRACGRSSEESLLMPQAPWSSVCHALATPTPSGVTRPRPVTTTLRTCSGGGMPNASSMSVTFER